jgi:hypothetical protein
LEKELAERRAQAKKHKGQGANEVSNGGTDDGDEGESGGGGSEAEDMLEQATTPEHPLLGEEDSTSPPRLL